MSVEAERIVRDAFDALASGGVEAMLPLIHPDFEGVVPPELSAEPDTYRGHQGVRRYFELFDETMEDVRFHIEEAEQHPGDQVLIRIKVTARGRSSGVPVDIGAWQLVALRDGRVARIDVFADRDSALAELDPGAA